VGIRLDAHRGPQTIGVAINEGALQLLKVDALGAAAVAVPAEHSGAGLRLDIVRTPEEPAPRLLSLVLSSERPPVGTAFLAAVLLSALALAFPGGRGPAWALAGGGMVSLGFLPVVLVHSLPHPSSAARLAVVLLLMASSVVLGHRADDKGRYWAGFALLGAIVFGAWVRLFFLFSHGSWDTEYWKAWMRRATSHGVTRVYGDPGALPADRVLSGLRGQEDLFRAGTPERRFVVDYPPLAMTLWRGSWWLVSTLGPPLPPDEAENVAVKLPAVAGDVVAAGLLLMALGWRSRRGIVLSVLYWIFPGSWLSSAVLGYFDAAYVPLVAASIIRAAGHRAASAGALLALAMLVKPTAVLALPAVAGALTGAGRRAPLHAAVSAAGVTALVVLPFLIAGTLGTAFVQSVRIFSQERLSGGCANLWWIVGHAARVTTEGWSVLGERVTPVLRAAIAFPTGAFGGVVFLLVVFLVFRWQRRHQLHRRLAPAALAAATLFLGYGMLMVGVHENHPHAFWLLLLLSGLESRRLQWIAAGLGLGYTLNLFLLAPGLGRFHSYRYHGLETLAGRVVDGRMAAGFDLTLALAAVQLVLCGMLLVSLIGLSRPTPPHCEEPEPGAP
jgi:hypothetical protein